MNLDSPLSCLTFNFQRTARSLVRGFEAAVKHLDLSAPQFTTLSLLSGFGPMTVSQLADRIGTERTTMTRNLDVMMNKGWIAASDSKDLRLRVCQITPEGRALLAKAVPAWQKWQARLVEIIGADNAQTMLATMAKL
ncbi:MAG: MarR family winged helix-turn-helix transcriptional regulator [Paracoccaceae bacterium]